MIPSWAEILFFQGDEPVERTVVSAVEEMQFREDFAEAGGQLLMMDLMIYCDSK